MLKHNYLQSYPQVVYNMWITCILQDMEYGISAILSGCITQA